MCIQKISVVAFWAVFCLIVTSEAAPLSLQDQLQVALQRVAELKGNGTFQSCCNISWITQDVFKTDSPESGIFDIPDVCGEQTNSFFKKVPKTQARCDFQNGGGWTVILRRNANVTHKVNFTRPWADYERGFGDLNTEFWYGLRNIHCLTNKEEVELQVEVRKDDGSGQLWTYSYFKVDGPEINYTLNIGQAQGPSSGYNSMANHNGMQFSTSDRDNDASDNRHCATIVNGEGWWFNNCYYALLTHSHSNSRIYWYNQGGNAYYHFAEMKLRPKNCKTQSLQLDCIPEQVYLDK